MTRQRKQQLTRVKAGKCQYCSNPLSIASVCMCDLHMDRMRMAYPAKRRNVTRRDVALWEASGGVV